MAVLSVLARMRSGILDSKFRFFCGNLARNGILLGAKNASKNTVVPVRSMGGPAGKRLMTILPSKYEYSVFKDQLHFFIALGVVPLGLVILYCNIFIGPATLTDIPDSYEPKRWEYYRHPIQRWFAKNIYNPPEMTYEITCHHFYQEQERMKYRALEKKVRNLMAERGDYKGWFYSEISDRKQVRGREFVEDVEKNWAMPAKFADK